MAGPDWRDIGEVSWEHRHWPRLGLQRIPTSLTLASPDHVATVIGQQVRWARACERQGRLVAQLANTRQGIPCFHSTLTSSLTMAVLISKGSGR